MLQPQRALKALESWETVSPRNQKRELPRGGRSIYMVGGFPRGFPPNHFFYIFCFKSRSQLH